jgi:aspartyl protease family protein
MEDTAMRAEDEIQGHKRMGTVMQALAWLALIALGIVFFTDVLEKQYNPNKELQTRHSDTGAREVVLQRNKFGHYITSGEINGKPVTFMLDTGATGVAIPENIASYLEIQRGRAFPTQTANGRSVSYAANLDRVSVGAIELKNVRAAIAPGLQTEEILLGMSFLKHIEFSQKGNTLILRQ